MALAQENPFLLRGGEILYDREIAPRPAVPAFPAFPADPTLVQVRQEISIEKSVLRCVTKLPEDMERLISVLCPEAQYQKSLVKAEYIGENVDNIMFILRNFSKLRLFKAKTHITNLLFNRTINIRNLNRTAEDYKKKTKNGIIQTIYSLLQLGQYKLLIEPVFRGKGTKKERLAELIKDKLDTVYKIVKGIEYQNSVYIQTPSICVAHLRSSVALLR